MKLNLKNKYAIIQVDVQDADDTRIVAIVTAASERRALDIYEAHEDLPATIEEINGGDSYYFIAEVLRDVEQI